MVLDNTDCFDENADAQPGQTGFFTAERGDGRFDYNCDGNDEQEFPTFGVCRQGSFGGFCTANPGWINTDSIPQCGESGKLQLTCPLTSPFTGFAFERVQACR